LNGIGKALPKRRNVVISSKKIDVSNIETFSSIKKAISSATTDVWLIGGASIYADGMKYAGKILLTITPDIIIGDVVRFPWIHPLKFVVTNTKYISNKLEVLTYTKI